MKYLVVSEITLVWILKLTSNIVMSYSVILKKNYLRVLEDDTVNVKGLTGKKSHTPPFIQVIQYFGYFE